MRSRGSLSSSDMEGRLERYANGKVVARVRLSRRNLLTLLRKLEADHGDEERTIWRDLGGGLTLAVTADDDDTHYAIRPDRRASVWFILLLALGTAALLVPVGLTLLGDASLAGTGTCGGG